MWEPVAPLDTIPSMKINLPEKLRQAAGLAPVEVQDETTQELYYLMSSGQYEKLRWILEVEQADPSIYEARDIYL